MKNWKKICFALGILVILLVSYFSLDLSTKHGKNFALAQSPSITIITLTKDNTLLSGTEYSITPDPFKNTGTYIIKDNSAGDVEKDKGGIITITGIKNGNYTITQIKAPSGYDTDKLSKIVEVKDASAVASFTNILEGTISVGSGRSEERRVGKECRL